MATYDEIREVVKRKHPIYAKNCWIAHVKELNGLPLRSRRTSPRVVPCPDRWRSAVEDAMRELGMIPAHRT